MAEGAFFNNEACAVERALDTGNVALIFAASTSVVGGRNFASIRITKLFDDGFELFEAYCRAGTTAFSVWLDITPFAKSSNPSLDRCLTDAE
ncbi:MAG: hypothetical protein AAFZ74_19185 [Pseudomonadota bacterium]